MTRKIATRTHASELFVIRTNDRLMIWQWSEVGIDPPYLIYRARDVQIRSSAMHTDFPMRSHHLNRSRPRVASC